MDTSRRIRRQKAFGHTGPLVTTGCPRANAQVRYQRTTGEECEQCKRAGQVGKTGRGKVGSQAPEGLGSYSRVCIPSFVFIVTFMKCVPSTRHGGVALILWCVGEVVRRTCWPFLCLLEPRARR